MYNFRAVEQCLDRLGKWVHTSSSSYLKIRSRELESRLGLYEKLICMGANRNTIEKIVRDSYPYPLTVVRGVLSASAFIIILKCHCTL